MRRWLVVIGGVAIMAGCGGSALVSGPSPTPSPSPSPSPGPQGLFVPAGAVLYGAIAQERPNACYPLEEAARFALLDLSMYLAGRTSRWCGTPDRPLQVLRGLNPTSVILLYRIAPAELNWTGGRGPVSGREYFDRLRQTNGIGSQDRWFAVGERTGDYLVDMYYPQYVAMELGNTNWRRFWTEQGWEDMWGQNPLVDARGASGIFVDGAVMVPYSNFPFCPMSAWDGTRCGVDRDYPDTYWDGATRNDALWRQHMVQFIEEVVPWHRARGLQVMFNAWTLNSEYVSLLNRTGGHAMEECGFVCDSRFPPDPRNWLRRLGNLQQATNFAILNTNAIVATSGSGRSRMDAVVWNGMRGWDVLWFAMTSFLLGYDPDRRNGYFHFTVAPDDRSYYRDTYWFDEYDPRYLHLGRPRGPAQQLSTGVWQREFDRGWVWVNPTGAERDVTVPSGTVRVLDHDTFRTPEAAQPVGSFRLGPWRGVIGLRP